LPDWTESSTAVAAVAFVIAAPANDLLLSTEMDFFLTLSDVVFISVVASSGLWLLTEVFLGRFLAFGHAAFMTVAEMDCFLNLSDIVFTADVAMNGTWLSTEVGCFSTSSDAGFITGPLADGT